MTALRYLVFGCVAALWGGNLRGQEGANDPDFNPADLGVDFSGANAAIYAMVLQPDGKVLIGGAFTSFNGVPTGGIARLNANGSLDTSFDPGTGVNHEVRAVVLEANGDILIGGDFTTVNGVPCPRIARLDTDGSVDTGFAPGSGPDSTVMCIALQSNGAILIGGYFTHCNGTVRGHIALLSTTGALDMGFAQYAGTNYQINCIAVQASGKILIGGAFSTYNGVPRSMVTRLDATGNLDPTFTQGLGANSVVHTMVVQPDGKVMLGGFFGYFDGWVSNRIARMNSDGGIDLTFNSAQGAMNNIYNMALQPDGKIIIVGSFQSYYGTPRNCIARVNANGTLDISFDPGSGAGFGLRAVAVQPDGKILIAGEMLDYNGTARGRIARVLPSGALDPTLAPITGANHTVFDILQQPDGKLVIAGDLTMYNGVASGRLARLLPDGSPDPTFTANMNATVTECALQPDGKILIAGIFTLCNGVTRNKVARLNANGTLDPAFDPGAGPDGTVFTIIRQADGKVLIGGTFSSYNGVARAKLARLNADGTLDGSFNAGAVFSDDVYALCLRPDGKILVGGQFQFNGTSREGVVLLNADGSSVSSFNTLPGSNGDVMAIRVDADNKVMACGAFGQYGGTARRGIVRLNGDGTIDPTFAPGTGASGGIARDFVVQPDGRIVMVGSFTTYQGVTRNMVVRINRDGSLDNSFDPGAGTTLHATTIDLQADGKIPIGGYFTSYAGVGRNYIARINGTPRAGIKVMLEGPYGAGTMTDALRNLPSFPLTEPFTAMGYAESGYVSGATIPSSVLSTIGNNAIVDWVLMEMRPVATPGTVAASRAVLLQRDGDVVDLDGVSTVGFAGLASGNYCVAVKPRNHLPVMLSATTPVSYGAAIATVDFTLPTTLVYDNDARKNVSGVMVLAAGDVSFNETVQYTGSGNDRDPILTRVGSTTPNAAAAGYWREDVNLDGVVKYTGSGNDRDIILTNVGSTTPNNTRAATLP